MSFDIANNVLLPIISVKSNITKKTTLLLEHSRFLEYNKEYNSPKMNGHPAAKQRANKNFLKKFCPFVIGVNPPPAVGNHTKPIINKNKMKIIKKLVIIAAIICLLALLAANIETLRDWSLSYSDTVIQLIILFFAVPYFIGLMMYVGKILYLWKSTKKTKQKKNTIAHK